MSKKIIYPFLSIDNLIYKCKVETEVNAVELKKKKDDNNNNRPPGTLFLYLKCPMTFLTMSIHELLKMIFDEFVIIDKCYKVNQPRESTLLTDDDIVDLPIENNFKSLSKSLHILPNGVDNCILELHNLFYDSDTFNVVEKVEATNPAINESESNIEIVDDSSDDDFNFQKKVTIPKKISKEDELKKLKKCYSVNKKQIRGMFEHITYLQNENYDLNEEIEKLEKEISKTNI
jgi:hypothetical protein